MNSILFCMTLKKNCLAQYKECIKEALLRQKEWGEMLKRYDLHSVSAWHHNINDKEYVFVQHNAGPQYAEKLKGWETSEHPFDIWFRHKIMAVLDIDNIDGMIQLPQLVHFHA